jgi:hypothetical protein
MITIHDLMVLLPCRSLTGPSGHNRPVGGGYAGDLLSWVMAHAEAGDVWLTILNSINVVAVAELTDCACVLLTEAVGMDEAVLQKARARGVVVLQTDLPTFSAAGAIFRLLQADEHP